MLKIFIAVFLSALVMLVVPAYAQNQTQSQSQEWLTYDDPILGISVQYPKSWEPIEEPGALSFKVFDNESKPSIFTTIGVSPSLEIADTNEKLMKGNLNELRGEISKIQELNNATEVNGEPAAKAVYITKDETGNDNGRTIAYFMVRPDKSYFFSFITQPTDYDKHLPTIQKMVNSFKIQ
ncbi:MAG: PsbP-related protein [Nitrososphaeraceae archaeon]